MTPTSSGSGPTEPSPLGAAGSTSGAGWHPAVEEISQYTEDLLRPEMAQAVRTHLEECPECADTLDALREIRALLGHSDTPRMPADVAGRIDAALAAEALLASSAPWTAGAPRDQEHDELAALLQNSGHDLAEADAHRLLAASDRDTGWDKAAPPRSSSEAPRTSADSGITPPDSARAVRSLGTAKPSGPSGPRDKTPPSGSSPRRRSRRRRVRILLTTAALAAAVALGGVLVHGTGQPSADRRDAAASSARAAEASGPTGQLPKEGNAAGQQAAGSASGTVAVSGTGTKYTERDLSPQIMRLIGNPTQLPAGASPMLGSHTQASPDQPSPQRAARPALPGCVLEATGRQGDTPVATDRGTFQGDPVGVVVYRVAASGNDLEVFLVDATCETTAPASPGTVRLHRIISGY